MKLLIYRSCSGWAMELVVYIILLTCNLLIICYCSMQGGLMFIQNSL